MNRLSKRQELEELSNEKEWNEQRCFIGKVEQEINLGK